MGIKWKFTNTYELISMNYQYKQQGKEVKNDSFFIVRRMKEYS